uniref:Uncharacterized protein n=1 Tax=Anopheles farauti TaxID=69004 RepID=A0A182Q6D4_9DIPT
MMVVVMVVVLVMVLTPLMPVRCRRRSLALTVVMMGRIIGLLRERWQNVFGRRRIVRRIARHQTSTTLDQPNRCVDLFRQLQHLRPYVIVQLELLHAEQTMEPGRTLDPFPHPLQPLLELVHTVLQQLQVVAHDFQLARRVAQVAALAEMLAGDVVELLKLLLTLLGRLRTLERTRFSEEGEGVPRTYLVNLIVECALASHLAEPLAALLGQLFELPCGTIHLTVDGDHLRQPAIDNVLVAVRLAPISGVAGGAYADAGRTQELFRWFRCTASTRLRRMVVRTGHEDGGQLQVTVEQLQRALDRVEKGELRTVVHQQMERHQQQVPPPPHGAKCYSSQGYIEREIDTFNPCNTSGPERDQLALFAVISSPLT